MFTILNVLIAGSLSGCMLAFQEAGRRLSQRDRGADPKSAKLDSSATDGAVYALLALLIAFTFPGAASRYDARRHLVVDEATAITTAWRRIDLLPTTTQPAIRDLFREYVDARLDTYRVAMGNAQATARAVELQRQIWSASVAAATAAGEIPSTVYLPALNDMIDITTARAEARRMHSPLAGFLMLGVVALLGSLFAGYGMAAAPRSPSAHAGFRRGTRDGAVRHPRLRVPTRGTYTH